MQWKCIRSTPGTPASRGHYHIQALTGQPVSVSSADELPLRAEIRYDAANQHLEVHFLHCMPGRYDLRLYDLHARVYSASALPGQAGTRQRVALPGLPGGLYIAELSTARQRLRKKLLID